jgi:5-methyltetrahydropteroyltriglutamate--homocysteine methyltransferase
MKPLTTHEIGSLAKPSWRVKAIRNLPLTDDDIDQAKEWGQKLQIDETEELLSLLENRDNFTQEEKKELIRFSSLFGIKLLESAGLDLVWDGEQHRVEMYEYPIKHTEGFAFHGHVRSFDNKYYRRASCESVPECSHPYHLEEYHTIARYASKEIKIPVTGAYTLGDWSYDAHYCRGVMPGDRDVQEKRVQARSEFIRDISRRVVYPNLKALIEAGAPYLQIDEPAATTKRAETDLFIESMKESIGDLAGKAFFSVHICYSVYDRLFPKILELEGMLDEIHLEYANRDNRSLGVSEQSRPGYALLRKLKDTPFKVGLGVLDIHTDWIEPPELIRDRILYAVDVLGDPSRILVSPDCGLRTRTWEVSYQKLKNMTEGVLLASEMIK